MGNTKVYFVGVLKKLYEPNLDVGIDTFHTTNELLALAKYYEFKIQAIEDIQNSNIDVKFEIDEFEVKNSICKSCDISDSINSFNIWIEEVFLN